MPVSDIAVVSAGRERSDQERADGTRDSAKNADYDTGYDVNKI